MLKHTTSKIASILFLSFIFASCQKNDTDLLQEAQSCLNNSPSSEARNCVSKISNLTSAPAYKLRCAAIFIQEGYGAASSLINGLNDINNPTGGGGCTGNCSPTFGVISNFTFDSGDNSDPQNRSRNTATADEAVMTCALSESKAYVQVSSLFKIGTLSKMTAYAVTGGAEPTPAQIEAALGNLQPAEISQIGQVVVTTFNSACTNNENPSESAKKFCDELSVSINDNGTNYNAIGSCLIEKIKDANYVCP